MQEYIQHDPPLWTDANAVYPYTPALERKYKFISRYGDEVLLHKLMDDKILLPRGVCPVGPNDLRDVGKPANFEWKGKIRPEQEKVFKETEQAVVHEERSGIVCAYTGWGKTVLGYYIASKLKVKTLVITTKEDIFNEWINNAKTFLGEECSVGRIRQDKCETEGTNFVVALIQSLSKEGKYPDYIVKGFGFVIFDECHRVPADQFSVVAGMFPAKYRLGLSATPERSDGKEVLVSCHIGPLLAMTDYQLMVPKVLRYRTEWKCPIVPYKDKAGNVTYKRLAHEAGKTTHIEKIVAADPERNAFIVDLIKSVHSKGRMLIVFSTLTDHLRSIRNGLKKTDIPPKDIGFYIGASTKAELAAREKAKGCPVLLATYGMMSEGTNLPWFDTALLAMPRANVTQPVGRIRRQYPDKKPPAVIDLMDIDSPVMAKYASRRMQWYTSIDAEVKDMN